MEFYEVAIIGGCFDTQIAVNWPWIDSLWPKMWKWIQYAPNLDSQSKKITPWAEHCHRYHHESIRSSDGWFWPLQENKNLSSFNVSGTKNPAYFGIWVCELTLNHANIDFWRHKTTFTNRFEITIWTFRSHTTVRNFMDSNDKYVWSVFEKCNNLTLDTRADILHLRYHIGPTELHHAIEKSGFEAIKPSTEGHFTGPIQK